ncbi:acetylglutamate kinase [Streptomyces sp. NPDC006463]|uniref:acetylglutamate kinase n=1 Tax=Streptomyces sp. NPDC006463 TaxID=3364746 RepID=UPI0036AC8D56
MSTAEPAIVVKYGGAAMDGGRLSTTAMRDLTVLAGDGRRLVLVHGGGRTVTEEAARRGLTPRFVDGLRVTDPDMMDVVRMVLVGRINKDLVGQLQGVGVPAIGLSGEDAGLMTARTLRVDGVARFGRVGEVAAVDTKVLTMAWEAGLIPVVASVAPDAAGLPHNVNADTAAAALAVALPADRLVYVSDVEGLMADPADPASIIPRMGSADLAALLRDRPPRDGMMPKLSGALTALRSGVPVVRLVGDDSLLSASTADTSRGTTLHV